MQVSLTPSLASGTLYGKGAKNGRFGKVDWNRITS